MSHGGLGWEEPGGDVGGHCCRSMMWLMPVGGQRAASGDLVNSMGHGRNAG